MKSGGMKSFRNIRVIPVVVIAICCLAVLKVAGLVIDGGYVFEYNPNRASPSWAQENINYPGAAKVASAAGDPSDISGSAHGESKEKKAEEKPKVEAPETKPEGVVIHPEENQPPVSASERAILERLQSRRQELDARAREIDIRESLLKEAEKRISTKVDEMKAAEAKTADEARAKAEAEGARLKSLITTYEDMK